jgi:outer membrane protein OmpA-like peptidoglycan-associated protein
MRYIPLFLLVFGCFTFIDAQNLVKNPSFENAPPNPTIMPCTYSNRGESFNHSIYDWTSYQGLTPDILTYDAQQSNCFPLVPHSGKRMAGIITYHPYLDSGYSFDYHEYLQGELTKPLKFDQTYTFECWVYSDDSIAMRHLRKVLGDKATTIIPVLSNNIGVLFSESKLESNGLAWRNFLTPDKKPLVYTKLLNTNGKWKKIQFLLVADKPYRYFYIGNFFEDKNTITTLSPERSHYIDSLNAIFPKTLKDKGIFWERKKRIAYYCIDDVSLRAGNMMEEEEKVAFMPEVSYTFQSIVFETGKATLIEASCSELDGLIAFLKKNNNQKIIITGHTDNVGLATANMLLSQKRAEAVRNYLIKNGLLQNNIRVTGKGDTQPVADNGSEIGRQQNRRVEIKLQK